MTEDHQSVSGTGPTRRGFVAGSTATIGSALVLGAAPTAFAGPAPAAATRAGARIPAFPGAEGAGMYSTGGRGGEVYEVTTLADSGPGSLREAVSVSNRTVVFRVSGTIELAAPLLIAGSNLTIAGQTAPGDGICISGHNTNIKANAHDIVIRYLRFRLGDVSGQADDAFNTNVPGSVSPGIRNLIIDHCSFSWAVDECLSPYGNFDVTVQWCIISEGLTLSAHPKSRHGYGGLWGGERNTYHHNLLAHQGGRNPRFSFTEKINLVVDHRNNVIYNYGYTSCYGGEWANGINIVGNYYKPGPDTLADVAPVILSANRGGQWHVDGNHVEGHPQVTAHNRTGIRYPVGGIAELSEPVPFATEIESQSAQAAYDAVLVNAGAVLPRRDAVDARVVNDVRNGTGRLINSQSEVGGWPPLASAPAPVDSDHDGIPDEWELANGLNPNDPSDANKVAPNGYTYLENYLNSIVPAGHGNPTVRITSPSVDQVVATRQSAASLTVEASASAANGTTLGKVEFFAGDRLIGTAAGAPYRVSWSGVADGTYHLTARATDAEGTATTSSAVPVHVNLQTPVSPWLTTDVGSPPIAGSAGLVDGVLTIKGSGRITGRGSSFHFVYQRMTVGGAGEVTQINARLDQLAKVANGAVAGLMIRNSLDPNGPFMFGGLGFGVLGPSGVATDGGMMAQKICIQTSGPQPSIGPWPWEQGKYLDPAKKYWLRLLRRETKDRGDVEFEAFISEDKVSWTRFGYERIAMPGNTFYIGLAVDGGKEANAVAHYGAARFTEVRIGL
jgi:pectate lyase